MLNVTLIFYTTDLLISEIILGLILFLCSENTIPSNGHVKM